MDNNGDGAPKLSPETLGEIDAIRRSTDKKINEVNQFKRDIERNIAAATAIAGATAILLSLLAGGGAEKRESVESSSAIPATAEATSATSSFIPDIGSNTERDPVMHVYNIPNGKMASAINNQVSKAADEILEAIKSGDDSDWSAQKSRYDIGPGGGPVIDLARKDSAGEAVITVEMPVDCDVNKLAGCGDAAKVWLVDYIGDDDQGSHKVVVFSDGQAVQFATTDSQLINKNTAAAAAVVISEALSE